MHIYNWRQHISTLSNHMLRGENGAQRAKYHIGPTHIHTYKRTDNVICRGRLVTTVDILFLGAGVNVIIIDDGLDHSHPDLVDNYRPSLRYSEHTVYYVLNPVSGKVYYVLPYRTKSQEHCIEFYVLPNKYRWVQCTLHVKSKPQ